MTAGAVAACKNAGVHYHRLCFEIGHVRLLLGLGRNDDAAAVLGELDAALEVGGELNHRVDLSLAKAELDVARGNPEAARDHYREAMAAAERQSALSWQLRAALGLAGLETDAAVRKSLIAPLYARFEEGMDTMDLKAAAEYL